MEDGRWLSLFGCCTDRGQSRAGAALLVPCVESLQHLALAVSVDGAAVLVHRNRDKFSKFHDEVLVRGGLGMRACNVLRLAGAGAARC